MTADDDDEPKTDPQTPTARRVRPGPMTTSAGGRADLEKEEGEVLHWYLDFAKIPTIGVGHRILPTDPWKKGDVITQDVCDALLENDLRVTESCVNSFTTNIGQNMFDALVSLGFNIGTGAERVSSVAKMMRVGGYLAAADHFLDWNKAVIDGKLQVSADLSARRARERAVFLRDVSTLEAAPDSDRIVSPGDVG